MQSGRSLNLMCPPFNLHSLCLCYYLHPHIFASFPSSKLSCFSFCLSLQMLMHPFFILLVLSFSLQSTCSHTLPWDGRGPCGQCLRQHSRLGSSVCRMTSLTEAALSSGWGHGVGAPEPPHLSCEGPHWPGVLGEAPPVQPIPVGAWETCRLLSR